LIAYRLKQNNANFIIKKSTLVLSDIVTLKAIRVQINLLGGASYKELPF
jgi:hypothetical protein